MAHDPESSDETFLLSGQARHNPTGRFTPGTMLAGRYRLVAPLGKGGMGEVYRADDTRLGQPVALKFLPAAFAADEGRLDRLRQEVSLGRQISHPNVCRLYDIAEANGHHFLVMEYVDGEDLASLLRRIGRLPEDKAVEIARGLCAGLAAAHDKGVIHRDLKPANVMIDGRGHARIADFGLAEPVGAGRTGDLAGTISYMAPEQLAGTGATVQSDIFALGLILYEMFTGRRAFEAKSIEEYRALYAESTPPKLSGSGADVDRAVERVIMRCLAIDPAARPASAQVVHAALPGGDPLQAAIVAGETPSPEMVAASSKVGDLRPAIAWACLIAGVLGLLLISFLGGRVMLYRRVSLPKPPEAMADRARDVLTRLGYPQRGVDNAYEYFTAHEFLDHVVREDSSPARWATLGAARPGPILFYYRESPRPLVSTSWLPSAPWEGPADLAHVTLTDPPMTQAGMTTVTLDPQGRFTSLVVVPPLFDENPQSAAMPDWSAALVEAGFNPGRLSASMSRWAAPVDSDRRAAWDGALDDQPDVTFHIEAASYHGRLVSFTMRGPWVQPPRETSMNPIGRALVVAMILFAMVFSIVPALWARRNVRLGRGDRNGASRVAVFGFTSLMLGQLVGSGHSTLPITEFSLVFQIISQALTGSLLIWGLYLGLEPSVRKRSPHALISWSRLVAGRFRDPMVGRDVLAGLLGGMVVAIVASLDLAGFLLSRVPVITPDLGPPNAPSQIASLLLILPSLAVFYGLGTMYIFSVFQTAVRRAWIAGLLIAILFVSVGIATRESPIAGVVEGTIFGGMVITVMTRFGLLSATVLLFAFTLLGNVPLNLDASVWYAGRSFVVLALFTALLVTAFHTSLGGKPLFGRSLIED